MAGNFGYNPPGVSVTELVNPSVAPIFERPTNISIVGEALGYQSVSNEAVYLEDNNQVTLRIPGVNTNTIVVTDAYTPNLVYVNGVDYDVLADGDFTKIRRKLYTTINSGENLVIILVTTGDNTKTRLIGDTSSNGFSITGLSSVTASAPTADVIDQVFVQRRGLYNTTTDYQTSVSGTTSAKVWRRVGGRIQDGQKIYVSYTTNTGANIYLDEEVVLTGTSAPSNPGNLSHYAEGVDINSIVVRNAKAMGSDVTAVTVFSEGGTADYTKTVDNGGTPNPTLTLTRSAAAPTTIGASDGKRTVRVSYQATQSNYYIPQRFYNYNDVESFFGKAFDSTTGTVLSPLSFGAYLAFANGAPDIVCQAVFHTDDPTNSQAPRTAPSNKVANLQGYLGDWTNSFASLRDFPEVNVIVPIIGQSSAINDSSVLTVLSSLQDHIAYMADNDEHVFAVCGEDSSNGQATIATLQGHANVLGQHVSAENTQLVSPAAFAFPNAQSVTGQTILGGQYVAAAMAGMYANRPVQDALTRKGIVGFVDVKDYRSVLDMNNDAQAGLAVIQKKNGNVIVRHSITTAVNNINSQEASVVRSKFYMVESIQRTLDIRLIGNIPADDTAPTRVGGTVQGVLDTLVQQGVIVNYAALQAAASTTNPTIITVRFSYKPSYPLNYIQVQFNIDVTTGSTTVTTSNTGV